MEDNWQMEDNWLMEDNNIGVVIQIMIVNSSFFKKEFDVSQAELIGEGNFAQVFRVYDSDHGDSLAIRRVDRNMGESEDIEKEKVINEELRKVDNENILKIYDIIETDKCVWYITEFCEGGSLWDALNDCKDNRMNEKDALAVIQQVSKGVRELHNHRITHRDLKPENILLKTKYVPGKPIPEIKLADFGLSTKKIIMETIAGTKEYIAPEQARFHNYTNAVDVWSLGIIFDEILHGNPFYIGDNNKEVFDKILRNPYTVRDDNIRPSIKNFLMRILKKKPYERPIIASICQTIDLIISEIGEVPLDKPDRPDEKYEKKSVNFIELEEPKQEPKQEQPPDPKEAHLLAIKESQLPMPGIESRLHSEPSEPKESASQLSSSRKIERKQTKERTPFKRQNTHLNELKRREELESDRKSHEEVISPRVGRVPSRAETYKGSSIPAIHLEAQVSNQAVNSTPRKEKVGIYRFEKRKLGQHSHKTLPEVKSDIVPIREYMDKIVEMKGRLHGSSLEVGHEREFIPNMHMTAVDLPDKMKGEDILKAFRQEYDCLNYMSCSEEYEVKLLKGRNELKKNKARTEKELLEYKERLRESFLKQIDRYVDLYVSKVIQ